MDVIHRIRQCMFSASLVKIPTMGSWGGKHWRGSHTTTAISCIVILKQRQLIGIGGNIILHTMAAGKENHGHLICHRRSLRRRPEKGYQINAHHGIMGNLAGENNCTFRGMITTVNNFVAAIRRSMDLWLLASLSPLLGIHREMSP